MQERQCKSRAAQNQFTAYLVVAIRNYKKSYLKKRAGIVRAEVSLEEYEEAVELSWQEDFLGRLPLAQQLENERLLMGIRGLKNQERYIFLAKALEGKRFSEIARSVGMTYGAVAMSYHRTVARLRRVLGGTEHD